MLNLVDRYIAKLFLSFFLGGLVVFVTIFLAVDFMGSFARYEVSIDVLFRYYSYFLPSVVYQMVPVACLVGTIFTLSTLNRTNELIALFSVGMSLARVCFPILALVAVISVLTFWVGDRLLPRFAQQKTYIEYVEIKNKPGLYSTVKTDKIWYRSQNTLFNIQTLNPNKAQAQGLTLYYFDSQWNLIQLIQARDVKLKSRFWELQTGTVTLFPENQSFPLTREFDEKVISMSEDLADIQSTANSSDVMSIKELARFIKKNKEAGLETLRYEVDYQGKYAFALAAFVMSLMGIPFSVGSRRSGGAFVGVGLCLGFAVLYWILFSSSMTLGKNGLLPPMAAAWSPNILMGGLSIYFLLRLRK